MGTTVVSLREEGVVHAFNKLLPDRALAQLTVVRCEVRHLVMDVCLKLLGFVIYATWLHRCRHATQPLLRSHEAQGYVCAYSGVYCIMCIVS